MKITPQTITYIQNVVDAAKVLDIDSIIVEPDCVRGMDSNQTVVILQKDGVPDLPFGSVGINRIGVFYARLGVVKTQENFTIDAVSDDTGEFVRSLTLKATGTKVDYRCANPTTIKAPRQVNDTVLFKVDMTAETIVMLDKGYRSMGVEEVTIVSKADGVVFEFTDINGDVFSHKFADTVEFVTDETDNSLFAHRYPVKTLLAIFKGSEGSFMVGKKGILKTTLNGLDVFVLPKV